MSASNSAKSTVSCKYGAAKSTHSQRDKVQNRVRNLCAKVPKSVPKPDETQPILHPHKDVFVLKVSKVDAQGDRRCKMQLELVSPKGPELKPRCRLDTRETQCDPDPPPCNCCCKPESKRKKSPKSTCTSNK